MTCRSTSGDLAVQINREKDVHSPCQIYGTIKLDEAAQEEQTDQGKDLTELRGRDRGRPPILHRKKSSFSLRDIFQKQEMTPPSSKTTSPVVSSPDKVLSPDEITGAPAQEHYKGEKEVPSSDKIVGAPTQTEHEDEEELRSLSRASYPQMKSSAFSLNSTKKMRRKTV